ncbi:hypothetical protein G6F65_015142 [Rhizopus arrhizus]|nr:hypothetical protein G6F65_015142 [Rhizopus arrhizus]
MRRTATFLLALAASMAGIAHAAPPAMQTVESVDLKPQLRGRHDCRIHRARRWHRGREQPLPHQGRRYRFSLGHRDRRGRQQQRQA